MTSVEILKSGSDDHKEAEGYRRLFNFKQIWRLTVLLTASVALIPLISMALIDYRVTQHSVESEILLRTSQYVSNTWRTVAFFLDERKSALEFTIHDNTFDELAAPRRLEALLANLKKGFGGFVDLGIIDASGVQLTYVGPYRLTGKNYYDQEWFREVLERGQYISNVFLGFRNVPHMVIAIRHQLPDGSSFVLRATLDMERFSELLSRLKLAGEGDSFIINHDGVLQTGSLYQGKVLEKIKLAVPAPADETLVVEQRDPDGATIIVGYAYIPGTPFILMAVKNKEALMKPWHQTRMHLIWFLTASITGILSVILGVTTYLVGKIKIADERRIKNLHAVEYSNKMASIGRLAAGVAHEINNPLAVINEKAGLIKDLFTYQAEYKANQKLMDIIDSVLASVERCGKITKRLLSFARHINFGSVQTIQIGLVIREVLEFMAKEAEHKNIEIHVDVPVDIPEFESDRGKLQQILLNLINNAFAAMREGGKLELSVRRIDENEIALICRDTGCGIPKSDLKRVFEPFFSTKTKTGGTGLGLSITYGLVQELNGKIEVRSEVGVGTEFTIALPLKTTGKEETNENPAGG